MHQHIINHSVKKVIKKPVIKNGLSFVTCIYIRLDYWLWRDQTMVWPSLSNANTS